MESKINFISNLGSGLGASAIVRDPDEISRQVGVTDMVDFTTAHIFTCFFFFL